jgi:hypothetical protein
MPTLRAIALAVGLAAIAAAGAAELIAPPCKNHYILSPSCVAANQVEWVPAPAPSLPYGPDSSATLLEDGRVLFAGDYGSGTAAEIYDPATGRWVAAAPMNIARSGHVALRLRDGRVLVVGGEVYRVADAPATAEIYDPAATRGRLRRH